MPDTPKQPDLDLIDMVQRARMAHDADAVPSAAGGVYWIEARPDVPGQLPTPRAGLWLIETSAEHVDAQWDTVRQATRAGRLGYKSKVSTSRRGGKGPQDQRVICVCTFDRDDAGDVERVRAALAELGLRPSSYE
jgi:hypothetical protein